MSCNAKGLPQREVPRLETYALSGDVTINYMYNHALTSSMHADVTQVSGFVCVFVFPPTPWLRSPDAEVQSRKADDAEHDVQENVNPVQPRQALQVQ